jgi:hypothetical protein
LIAIAPVEEQTQIKSFVRGVDIETSVCFGFMFRLYSTSYSSTTHHRGHRRDH